MSFWHRGHFATFREIVADGASVGTFKYPDLDTIHAYVRIDPEHPYLACGLHGLGLWEKYRPETMDRHDGPTSVSCGRCRRVLGDVLEEGS